MTIKIVDRVDVDGISKQVQVIVKAESGVVMLFQDDYCESEGVCFSRVDLTRKDLEAILALLP